MGVYPHRLRWLARLTCNGDCLCGGFLRRGCSQLRSYALFADYLSFCWLARQACRRLSSLAYLPRLGRCRAILVCADRLYLHALYCDVLQEQCLF